MGPGIAIGVVMAQLMTPHLRGRVMTGMFGLFTLLAAVRFAAPQRFKPVFQEPPNGNFRRVAHHEDTNEVAANRAFLGALRGDTYFLV